MDKKNSILCRVNMLIPDGVSSLWEGQKIFMDRMNETSVGRVYWITGLSGSGKTTLGTALYYDLRRERNNVLLLDGDLLKNIVNETVDYSHEARLRRGKQYSKICKLMAEQGLWVIICTVAMFDEIRDWNRKYIKGYVEIFLDVPFDILRSRDKKALYSSNNITLNDAIEFPKNPDIVLRNDGSISISDFLQSIKEIVPKRLDDFSRDRDYWNKYYLSTPPEIEEPSDFARTVLPYMRNSGGRQVLELGCGNGRDSLFFLKNGMHVTGVDASEVSIELLNKEAKQFEHAFFICDDFTKCRALFQRQYDFIYSRFTLHAITYEQETEMFENLRDALNRDGKIFIEARSINDDLYGLGKRIDEHTFIYNNHFRRFIDTKSLSEKLKEMGFEILKQKEGRGFSKTAHSDPVLVRLEVGLKS